MLAVFAIEARSEKTRLCEIINDFAFFCFLTVKFYQIFAYRNAKISTFESTQFSTTLIKALSRGCTLVVRFFEILFSQVHEMS